MRYAASFAHRPARFLQRARFQLVRQEAPAVGRAGQPQACRQVAHEAEALVVVGVADQQHGLFARVGRAAQRFGHQGSPDAFVTPRGIDRERPEEERTAAPRQHRPQAHGADERIASEGDQTQARKRSLAVAQALACLVPARLAERDVEQPLDRRRMFFPLCDERDHSWF